jgi:cytochrome c oxidase cbb3-type subunit 3
MIAWARVVLVAALIVLPGAVLALLRGERDYRPTPAGAAERQNQISETHLFPGAPPPPPPGNTHYEATGYDVAQGKHLFQWFNCTGCHGQGGGAIGPALMDDKWIYGSEPANIHQSIVEGRPNGMPSFRNKIADDQVWQLVAYIRSMSGLVPIWAEPSRNDDIQAKPPESNTSKQPPHPGGDIPKNAQQPG